MTTSHSKIRLVYARVRRDLQAGHYLPGQRIDPATLAAELNTSEMPARFALARLVGRGMLDHHARGGVYLPLPSELELRDRYEWMLLLLTNACDRSRVRFQRNVRKLDIRPEDDLVKLTWQLFDAIGESTGQMLLHDAVKRCNDRLAPIRRAKHHLIENPFEELAHLNQLWEALKMPALKLALAAYHSRRMESVPCIVATLRQQADRVN